MVSFLSPPPKKRNPKTREDLIREAKEEQAKTQLFRFINRVIYITVKKTNDFQDLKNEAKNFREPILQGLWRQLSWDVLLVFLFGDQTATDSVVTFVTEMHNTFQQPIAALGNKPLAQLLNLE